MIAGLYDLEETIGEGHYAVVKLARHVFTGEKVAVKVRSWILEDEMIREELMFFVLCRSLINCDWTPLHDCKCCKKSGL